MWSTKIRGTLLDDKNGIALLMIVENRRVLYVPVVIVAGIQQAVWCGACFTWPFPGHRIEGHQVMFHTRARVCACVCVCVCNYSLLVENYSVLQSDR